MDIFYYTVTTDKTKSVRVYSIANNVPKIEMNIHGIDLFSNTENKVKEKIHTEKNIDIDNIQLHIL